MPRPPAPEVRPVPGNAPSGALIGMVVVLVVALVGALAFWAATRGEGDLDAVGSANALSDGGGVSVGPGPDTDVPQVHVYGDPQCPWCAVLENSVGGAVGELVEAGEVNLTVTLMSFLDGRIRGDNSARAANAALCADDAGAFLAFYQGMYATQPHEGGGWTDEQLLALGEQAGVAGADLETFRGCVADRTHDGYVEAMQARANRDGVSGTPRMFVDGTEISDEEMRGLMDDDTTLQAVLADHS